MTGHFKNGKWIEESPPIPVVTILTDGVLAHMWIDDKPIIGLAGYSIRHEPGDYPEVTLTIKCSREINMEFE